MSKIKEIKRNNKKKKEIRRNMTKLNKIRKKQKQQRKRRITMNERKVCRNRKENYKTYYTINPKSKTSIPKRLLAIWHLGIL